MYLSEIRIPLAIFPIKKIDSHELENFAAKKFEIAGTNISEYELKEIIEVTECHPYYFQMLCHVLWEITLDDKTVKLSHIEKAIEVFISRESSAYGTKPTIFDRLIF